MQKIKIIFLVLLFTVVEIQASQKILHLLPGPCVLGQVLFFDVLYKF